MSTPADAQNDALVEELIVLVNNGFTPRNQRWFIDQSIRPHDLPTPAEMKERLAAGDVFYLRKRDDGPVVGYYESNPDYKQEEGVKIGWGQTSVIRDDMRHKKYNMAILKHVISRLIAKGCTHYETFIIRPYDIALANVNFYD